jgi:Coenzyme PQQ synthesis protein D (PqqD)
MSGKLYVARSSQVAARKLDDEMMIMAAPDSTLFTLNETATIVWEAADGSTPLDEIVTAKICPLYDVAWSEAQQDAEELVRQLAGHGILLLSEGPLSPASPPRPVQP